MRRHITLLLAAMLALASTSFAQQPAPPKPAPKPMTMPAPQPAAPAQQTAPAPQPRRQTVIIEEPIRVFDPFFDYPYPYAYPPDYMASNFGYVKIKTDRKDLKVYVDGGFADSVEKAHKFALRPGTHDIELRDHDDRSVFHEKVAVLVGKTTELHVG
jgi:hypothetical protein